MLKRATTVVALGLSSLGDGISAATTLRRLGPPAVVAPAAPAEAEPKRRFDSIKRVTVAAGARVSRVAGAATSVPRRAAGAAGHLVPGRLRGRSGPASEEVAPASPKALPIPLAMVRHLADMSSLAYATLDEQRAQLADRYPVVRPLGHGQGFIAANDVEVVVSFVGSRNVRHWMSNLRAARTTSSATGRVHRGFIGDFANLAEHVAAIHELVDGHKQLYVTGHSRGGALAQILAAQLKEQSYPNSVKVCTFGAPRVGDQTFATTLGDDLVRVENSLDPVPSLPIVGYVSAGHQLWLSRDSGLTKLAMRRTLRPHQVRTYLDRLALVQDITEIGGVASEPTEPPTTSAES